MNQNTKRILDVASDYSLIRVVKEALTPLSITLQIGYSHIDGLYALENGDFDAVWLMHLWSIIVMGNLH